MKQRKLFLQSRSSESVENFIQTVNSLALNMRKELKKLFPKFITDVRVRNDELGRYILIDFINVDPSEATTRNKEEASARFRFIVSFADFMNNPNSVKGFEVEPLMGVKIKHTKHGLDYKHISDKDMGRTLDLLLSWFKSQRNALNKLTPKDKDL
jgi:hypothetical protein